MNNNNHLLRNLTVIISILFIMRLFYLQLIDKRYEQLSNNNAVKIKYDYPDRGYIFDRNNVLLVANQVSFDIMVIPGEVKTLDTLEFCNLTHITKETFINQIAKATIYSPRLPSVFLKQLSKEDFGALQEVLHKFSGFYIQRRILRNYPIKSAANVLGYISEINEDQLTRYPYYQQGELMGTSGIEYQYEKELRGIKGIQYIQHNRFNKAIGSYRNGAIDRKAIPGKDLVLTIDTELQQYAELLMQHKRGGIIAIEPSSGEILAMVTAPSYDPNILVGRERSKNFTGLYLDSINRPLFDRGLLAQYPPGSTFKLANALIGLQEKVITTETTFLCIHGYRYGKNKDAFMKCHCGVVNTPINLNLGIYRSCNSYFASVYRRVIEKYPTPTQGLDTWYNHLISLGFGNYLGS
ncbi:MAG: penicillin-binding protein 2, partial [Flavobacteriales bacterium CG_4_8_14_3_um_filter_35_10]